MLHYSSAETKIRHKNIDSKLALTREAIEDPAFREALGGEYVDAQLSVLDSLQVPNVRHGVVYPSDSHSEDTIPVLSMLPYEGKLTLSPNIRTQHPLQEEETVRHLASLTGDDLEMTRSLLRSSLADDAASRSEEITRLGKHVEAKVVAPIGKTHVDTQGAEKEMGYTKLWTSRRPILLLPLSNRYYDSLAGVHEIEHILQTFRNPMIPLGEAEGADEDLSRELEAYTVQSLAASALYSSSANKKFSTPRFIKANDSATEIARAAAIFNQGKANQFEVTEELRHHLTHNVFTKVGKNLYLR